MTQQYVCDYCGKVFDNSHDAYACEDNHVVSFYDYDLAPELRSRYSYKPGARFPDKIVLAERRWNYDTNPEGDQILSFAAYKYVGEVSPSEHEKILQEQKDRMEREAREAEECRARWAAREAAKKAAEEQETA